MYEYKEIYTIDFTNVEHYIDVHLTIKEALDFPDYYGCNWDAFWDCLTDMPGDPIHIEIVGIEVLRKKFKNAADKILTILRRLKNYYEDYSDDILIEVVEGDKRIVIEWK